MSTSTETTVLIDEAMMVRDMHYNGLDAIEIALALGMREAEVNDVIDSIDE
jgi:helix-turn-helix protein